MESAMDRRGNPFNWSLSCGTWFGTNVRISVWTLLLWIPLWRLLGLELGTYTFGLLIFSILFHEFAHIIAARRTGGSGDEILLWPLGGLAYVAPAPTFKSQFWTAAAGPGSNLVLCIATFPALLGSEHMRGAFHLIQVPPLAFGEQWIRDVLILLFTLNWKLTWLNLIPAYPLDGSRMLHAVLAQNLTSETARLRSMQVGAVATLLIALGGLIAESVWLVLIGLLVLHLNYIEWLQSQLAPQYDEGFLGYDFSAGYSSLEREDAGASNTVGPIARWKQRRRQKRQEQEHARQKEAEQQLDALLEKVHLYGMDSLTPAEKRTLKEVSSRYRGGERT